MKHFRHDWRIAAGSSPRVWGRCYSDRTNTVIIMRFIPTRVGQMKEQAALSAKAYRFIPTRVGQMQVKAGEGRLRRGSSPRVWGRWITMLLAIVLRLRFIPTRVGQMAGASCCCTVLMVGSSPRVWGRFLLLLLLVHKIIAVHPHACGADPLQPLRSTTTMYGSSPRVWGRCA